MNNCLVTKLTSVVDNDNLEKINVLRLEVKTQENPSDITQRLVIETDGVHTIDLDIIGNGHFSDKENNYVPEGNIGTSFKNMNSFAGHFSNGDYIIEVKSKYNISNRLNFGASHLNPSFLKYTSGVTDIASLGFEGDIAILSTQEGLTKIKINSKYAIGSLSDLAPLTALTNIDFSDTNVSGDIKDLRNPITTMIIFRSNITGELIEFVKTQRSVGRTTGSCSNGGWWGDKVTFNGVNPGTGTKTLTWTENTITLGDVTVEQ